MDPTPFITPVPPGLEERHILHKWGLSAGQAMFLFALAVGVAAGLAAFVYFWMTETAVHAMVRLDQRAPSLISRALLVLAPAVGGLFCGLVFHYFAPDARGGGVSEVMDALLHRDGKIRLRVGFWKALASAVCIGSGGSTGREGPVVQIGASVGSALAQVFRITRERRALLVACGAAAGIAAVFNAPIAGVFFAAEVITGSFQMRDLNYLFIASVCSVVVARLLLWNHAAFVMPDYTFTGSWTIVLHFVLGALAAVAGHAFIYVLHKMEHGFRHSRIPEIVRPGVGGLLLGLLGVALGRPQILGTGTDFLASVFNGGFFAHGGAFPIVGALLLLLAAKILATSLTLGSGGAGGDLLPALFIGGMTGGAYGTVVHHFLPMETLPPGAFALVGAMAVFAGLAHAPITGIVLGIECGYHYGLVLPLVAACSVSALVSSKLRTASVYALKLEERGIDVAAARRNRDSDDPLDRVRVEDVMTRDFARVPPTMPLDDLLELFATTSHHGFVVTDDIARLLGLVTLSDARRAVDMGRNDLTVADVMTPAEHVITCTPSQPLREALRALGRREVGRIPVMDPLDTAQVIGVLRRGDILRGARRAATE